MQPRTYLESALMRLPVLLLTLLALCAPLVACKRSMNSPDVREFVDRADDAARKRFAPAICGLRGKTFTLHQKFQGYQQKLKPTEIDMERALFCTEAAKFSRIRQYKLERKSIAVDLAADHKTARVSADYTETMPYYEPDTMPATPDDFWQFQVLETRDESVVGIEGGDIVFLSTDSSSVQTLVSKSSVDLPYD
jgi:hypothetical protein